MTARIYSIVSLLLIFWSVVSLASGTMPDLEKACANKQAGDACDYGFGSGVCQMVSQKLLCLPQQNKPNP